jgi:hypothetical protein
MLELPLSESQPRIFSDFSILPPATRAPQVQGSWSRSDDEALLQVMSGQTNASWDTVAATARSRTAKQCRERWVVKLNPQIRKSPFEKWEDDLIRSERHRIGNHRSLIAQLLPGRTACPVNNRWYTALTYEQLPIAVFAGRHFYIVSPPGAGTAGSTCPNEQPPNDPNFSSATDFEEAKNRLKTDIAAKWPPSVSRPQITM